MDKCINSLPHHNNVDLVPNSKILIQTIWSDDSITFSLYVSNVKQGFRGTLLKSTLTKTAERFELNFDEFMAELKKALCTQNGLPNFTYILDPSNTFKFCKSTEKGFRITYGEVPLLERPDSFEEILMDSIELNQSKDQKIEMLQAEIRLMDEQFNEMKDALGKLVDEKVQMENSLLTKFAALLNTKKEKITELERAIKNRSIVADDFETDGSGDSDLDYCSQTYAREKSPAPSTSVQSDVLVVPKRSKNDQNVTIVEASKPTSTTEPMDIYDRETEVLLDDM